MIDVVETVYRGARKGRGLVIAPKDYSTKYRYVCGWGFTRPLCLLPSRFSRTRIYARTPCGYAVCTNPFGFLRCIFSLLSRFSRTRARAHVHTHTPCAYVACTDAF